MTFTNPYSNTIPIQLPNGATVKFEVAQTGLEKASASFDKKQFQPVADAIEGLVQMIATPIQKVKPKKASVKFGMELSIESGQLTAVIVKGSSKANLEITLEWEVQQGE
ncbi:MAG: CU044_2847 family protein [Cyanobacteria bacterium P01_A01_bin.123]